MNRDMLRKRIEECIDIKEIQEHGWYVASDKLLALIDQHDKEMRNEDYERGFIDGMTSYGWMKDGVYYVGSGVYTLKDAIENIKNNYNYNP